MAERPYEVADGAEFYPMALFPQLAVSDTERSTAWYERLGFEPVFAYGETVHLRYATGADLMLVGRGAPTGAGAGVTVYVNASEPLEDVFERLRTTGGTAEEPTETPYNTRELRLRDPDGYQFVFSEPVDTDRSFDEVLGGA
ncbi:VOC family protein [Salinirubellus salinus]|jgi:catechol 2,3-dioxygenase-like lactoylglutathione lyase family enzyme|uniref:VOC family protein n=1 Tax=Salinirubellus salinus TaxID=1364945 RepID=A0A9E7R1F4_9EURY|nr:VOC family protein [Salinirubellus salinus]UWM53846.1 VOC family protein [Salinirubellus salinus]